MSVLECPKPNPHAATVPARYTIDDRIVVQAPNRLDHALEVWVPVIPDTPFQRVLDLSLDANCSWSGAREAEFGNQMLHVRAADVQGWPLQISLHYQVERLPVPPPLHPTCARPLATPELFARHLAAEQFEVNDRTRALAAEILGGRTQSGGTSEADLSIRHRKDDVRRGEAVLEGKHRARARLLGRQLQRHPRVVHLARALNGDSGEAGARPGSRTPVAAWRGHMRSLWLSLLGRVFRGGTGLDSGGRVLCVQVRNEGIVRRAGDQSRGLVSRPRPVAGAAAAGTARSVFRSAICRSRWPAVSSGRTPSDICRAVRRRWCARLAGQQDRKRGALSVYRGRAGGEIVRGDA